jgi:hypothetical protein
MRRRLFVSTAAAVLAAGVISACGGGGSSDNGVASKSPDEIVNAATQAINNVNSVHVSGNLTSGGTPVTLDLHLVSGKGATGSMSQNGLSFKIVDSGQSVYINASKQFWTKIGGSAAAQLLNGKWLKAPANGANFASLSKLTDVHELLNTLLSKHGSLTKQGTSTINGQKVVGVKDTSNGGVLYVATTGKAYPVQVVKPGPDSGKLSFDKFNQSVSINPPSSSIDISQLKGQ